MKTVITYKAAPIHPDAVQTIPDTQIIIMGNVEKITEKMDLKHAEALYHHEAEEIAAALQDSLPQGVFRRLAAKIIERTAGSYIGRDGS